jgi:hypothetical protein
MAPNEDIFNVLGGHDDGNQVGVLNSINTFLMAILMVKGLMFEC